jgi:hypothetical protein
MNTTHYRPTREDVLVATASKERDIIIDRGDLGAMTEIVRDLGDAATSDHQRDLIAELAGFLEFMRLQLPSRP